MAATPNITLPPGQQLVAPGKWPLVGERAPAASAAPWTVSIGGLAQQEVRLNLEELRTLPQVEQVVDIHCVTRWSKLGVRFRGVSLAQVLHLVEPASGAKFVSFVACSDRQHNTSLPLDTALSLETLLALEVDGCPLSVEHGGPVRVVVPGRYFYKSLKWLTAVELLAEDRLGYWEANSGYHNEADPWRQQRYIPARLHTRHSEAGPAWTTGLWPRADRTAGPAHTVARCGLPRLQSRGRELRQRQLDERALRRS